MSRQLKYYRFLFLFILLSISFYALAQKDDLVSEIFAPPSLDDGWQVADVDFANLDQPAMEQLTSEMIAYKFNRILAVLIAHKEHLVYEYYWPQPGPRYNHEISIEKGRESLHGLRSITKSIVSLLLGAALEDNFKQALQRPVLDYLSDQTASDLKAKDISLENVLTMTAGFLWNEMEVPYTQYTNDENLLSQSSDPINYLLARPVRDKPGSRWYYNGGLTQLTAAVINSLIDKPLIDFAKQKLFRPLNIEYFGWSDMKPDSGILNAASGLRMNARDLLKIGSMVLNQGSWQSEQIIPSEWIELSTRRIREDLRTWGADGLYGYGYQWWHGRHDHFDAITALGYGGQRIFVLPEQELAVVVFAGNFEGDWLKPETILNRIVEARKSAY